MLRANQELRQLQQNRGGAGGGRGDRDWSIAPTIGATADHAARTHKQIGQVAEIWEQLVPPDVASHTAITGFRRGVLHVVVDSSAVGFELDRLLRAGLQAQLRARCRSTLVRVKTRVGHI